MLQCDVNISSDHCCWIHHSSYRFMLWTLKYGTKFRQPSLPKSTRSVFRKTKTMTKLVNSYSYSGQYRSMYRRDIRDYSKQINHWTLNSTNTVTFSVSVSTAEWMIAHRTRVFHNDWVLLTRWRVVHTGTSAGKTAWRGRMRMNPGTLPSRSRFDAPLYRTGSLKTYTCCFSFTPLFVSYLRSSFDCVCVWKFVLFELTIFLYNYLFIFVLLFNYWVMQVHRADAKTPSTIALNDLLAATAGCPTFRVSRVFWYNVSRACINVLMYTA